MDGNIDVDILIESRNLSAVDHFRRLSVHAA